MSIDLTLTPRASLLDGRQAVLLDGCRRVIVRIYDERPSGFRAATIQPTTLVEGAETRLQLAGRELSVRIVAKKMEGRRLSLTLARDFER